MAIMMSVYRQRQPAPLKMTMAECLEAAVTEDDTDLVSHAVKSNKPALIGLDNQSSIIKLVAEGDESLTFEALYDTCLTVVDLKRMREAGVATPEAVPKQTYRTRVEIELGGMIHIDVALFADSTGDVRTQFRVLWDRDPMFREAFFDVITDAMDAELRGGGELKYRILDSSLEPIDPPMKPGGPAWRFLDPS
jgi:hypothetical protein